MKNIIKSIPFALLSLGLWSANALAATTLYYNNFQGTGSAVNNVPSGTGLFGAFLAPPPPAADCTYTLSSSGLTSDCVTDRVPSADMPYNATTYIQTQRFIVEDPNNPGTTAKFGTNDNILSIDVKLSFNHNVKDVHSRNQANYYNTDVNDFRLGWGFFALVNPNSNANLCWGITANKVIAYVDGLSQTSLSDTSPGFLAASVKELADYTPGTVVSIRVEVDKVNQTGTYFVNGVKKLVINLAGQLPDTNQTTVVKTMEPFSFGTTRNFSMNGWTVSFNPMNSGLMFGSLGSASGRYTAGGLLDSEALTTIYSSRLGFPIHETSLPGYPSSPSVYVRPYGSWSTGSFAFGTEYEMTIRSIEVSSKN